MPFAIALAIQGMGMTIAEAVRAATAGGAAALRRRDIGRLVPGGRADLIALDRDSLAVRAVWLAGELAAGEIPDG